MKKKNILCEIVWLVWLFGWKFKTIWEDLCRKWKNWGFSVEEHLW